MTTQPRNEVEQSAAEAGQQLARARRARGMDLADAARELRLTRTTLQAIESGRMHSIAPIYRRGYVRNYAELLELDPAPLVDALGDAAPEPLRAVLPSPRHGQRFDRFVRLATYALVTTMIVPPLVYFFVQGGAQLFQGELPDDFAAVPTTAVDAPDAGRAGDDTDAAAGPPGHLAASAMPLAPIRTPVPVAPNPVESDPSAAAEPAETADPLTRLQLEFSGDSWVEITDAAGSRLEFDLLRAGQSREYRGRAPFRLLLGRASAVEVTVDGVPVEFDGQDLAGKAEVTLDAEVVADAAVTPPPGNGG